MLTCMLVYAGDAAVWS